MKKVEKKTKPIVKPLKKVVKEADKVVEKIVKDVVVKVEPKVEKVETPEKEYIGGKEVISKKTVCINGNKKTECTLSDSTTIL